MSKKICMDAVTRESNGTTVYIDFIPCPTDTPGEDWLAKAVDYYQELYPGEYIDVVCYNKRQEVIINTELAWAAGFFEGEGSVSQSTVVSKAGNTYSYLRLSVHQHHLPYTIHRLQKLWDQVGHMALINMRLAHDGLGYAPTNKELLIV